jgi:hypothetical protein
MEIGAGFYYPTGASGVGALKFKKGGVGQCEIVVDCHSHSKAIVLNC